VKIRRKYRSTPKYWFGGPAQFS